MTVSPETKTGSPDSYSKSIKPDAIERIVGMSQIQRAEFKKNYSDDIRFARKYRLARDLILDGRFPDQEFLLKEFRRNDLEVPVEERDLVNPFKERLHLLLIQKGVVPPQTMDKDTSERLLRGELRRKQDYQDLMSDGFPIEVIGQLLTVDLFSNISDAKKLEEYRAWVTKSLYRDFMGIISGKTPRRELSPSDIMARIPKKIFADPDQIKFHLTRHYIEERLMKTITDTGIQEGLAVLEQLVGNTDDIDRKAFLGGLVDRFYDIATEPADPKFNSTIYLKGRPKNFPSFEQMACCYDFEHYDTRLITADTGLGKTGTAYKIIEKSKATHALVLVPASGRDTWPTEEKKLFKQPGNVNVITGTADIEQAITNPKKYTVVSYELLGRSKSDPKLAQLLDRLIDEVKMDGGIADEIDELSNHKNVSVRTARRLLEKIRQNYAARTGESQYNAPIIGLTATPIRGRLSNLNVPVGLLYPERYAFSHGESTPTRKTFSDTYLNRPNLAYFALVGERLMFRWEHAAGVQEFEFEPVEVEISPFEELLYTFIANEIPTDGLNKIRILEDCLLNPLLIKVGVRKLAKGKIPALDIDKTMNSLVRAVEEWKRMRNISEPKEEADFLSADRLVELGLGNIVLTCFFSELLENGVDTLVEELTRDSKNPRLVELRNFWQARDISTKYSALKQLTQESLEWVTDPDGKINRQKVFIVSPARRQGRTGNVLQKQIIEENGEKKDVYFDWELDEINDSILITHLRDWVNGYCDPNKVSLIDGTVNVGRPRNTVIARWVDDPEFAVLLATLEATYQSRDFTLNNLMDASGRFITGVREILLAPPWHHQQLKQVAGRLQRQGQLVPADLKILQASGLIDQGKAEAVMYTYLLSRMALTGIILSPEQQEFFDSKRLGNRIQFQSPEARFLRDTFAWVRGAGEDRIKEYLRKQSSIKEITHDRLIAEKFYDGGKDAYRITGYNAELEAYLTKSLVSRSSRILSLGAGTLLYQRKLGRGVDNVDINPHMMEAGWQEAGQYGGRTIEAAMSSLSEVEFPSDSYKLVESAFALDWSNLDGNVADSERVKILSQINRVLENEGYLILTVPEKSLDDKRFNTWIEKLENHFGLQIDKERSGKSFGRSIMGVTKRLGWCIIGKKVGGINLDGLTLKNLEFANENGEWISEGSKKKNKRTASVQGRDYPTPSLKIEFDQYEIINNNQERVIILDSDGSEISVDGEDVLSGDEESKNGGYIPPSEDGLLNLDYLKGSTKEDRREYIGSLLRPIMRMAQLPWEDAEDLCSNTFREVQQKRKPIKSKLVAYSLILREVRKQINKNGKGVNR